MRVRMKRVKESGIPSTPPARRTGWEFTDVPEMLTAKDLEALLKIDVKTIYGYVQRGLIPYVRIQSNVRFLKSEIVKWIEECRFQTRPVLGNRN